MKNALKKILIILLAILAAVQVPFIYRRYKIGQLSGLVSQMNQRRSPDTGAAARDGLNFKEYKGIIHAHTSLGGHSSGTFDELIAAANANDLDFVIMTEHWSDSFDTAALTLNGVYGKTLFIGGNEIDTADPGDRFLMIPGSAEAASLRKIPTRAVLDKLRAEKRLAMVTYPEKLRSWDANFDGIEVFSLHTNAKKMNPFTAAFDALWSFASYPEIMLATYFKRPDENLRKFDELAAARKLTLFAGADAHSNIGFHIGGDDAGNRLLELKADDYETIFRLVRQHVLIPADKPFDLENLLAALRSGNTFIGIDSIGVTDGFYFAALSDKGSAPIGGEVLLADRPKLRISSPQPDSRVVVYLNGQRVSETAAGDVTLDVYEGGAYRVEVYLDALGPPFDKMPWIISNPIYVR